ncbi:hypothetical protein BH20ACT4_BH20ACT4_00650 [soil metagenome]
MTDETTELDDARAALDDARRRLAEVPAEVVVTNHAMGLYELAALHLSAGPPNLIGAQLAIDAVRAIVEGLGDRLGAEADTLRNAVANIQMAYVEIARRPAVGDVANTHAGGEDITEAGSPPESD